MLLLMKLGLQQHRDFGIAEAKFDNFHSAIASISRNSRGVLSFDFVLYKCKSEFERHNWQGAESWVGGAWLNVQEAWQPFAGDSTLRDRAADAFYEYTYQWSLRRCPTES